MFPRLLRSLLLLAAPALHAACEPPSGQTVAQAPAEEALPPGYPAAAPLDTINRWLHDEYSRRAMEAHRRAMEGVKMAPGSCGGVISVMVTPSVLPKSEWMRLSSRCVEQLGRAGVAAKREAIEFVSHLQQVAAIGNLPAILSPELRRAVTALTSDSSPEVRKLSLQVQWQIATQPPGHEELRSSIVGMNDPDASIRKAAMQALSSMTLSSPPEANAFGDLAPLAIEILRPLCDSEDRMTRLTAIQCLARTGDHVKPLMPDFAAWLNGTERLSRAAVYMSTQWLGALAEPLVPRLVSIAQDSSNPERARAVIALGNVRSAGTSAVLPLVLLVETGDADIGSLAILQLARLGPVAANAAPRLRALAEQRKDLHADLLWAADVVEGKRRLEDPRDVGEPAQTPLP